MVTTVIMHTAGVLWLVFGTLVFFPNAGGGGYPFKGELAIAGCLFMSFGMLLVGIGGIIGALRKGVR